MLFSTKILNVKKKKKQQLKHSNKLRYELKRLYFFA